MNAKTIAIGTTVKHGTCVLRVSLRLPAIIASHLASDSCKKASVCGAPLLDLEVKTKDHELLCANCAEAAQRVRGSNPLLAELQK